MGEAGVWLALLQLLLCPGNTSVLLYSLEWDGRLNFVAIRSKTVMDTAEIRVYNYQFGVTDLF